ncbi:peptidoglycan-binding protein [Candidatus Nomurabacteria bacterium]|nr:peptidoglycan-binding protein [Candidatus Nomurabacteria bacterium]
MVVAVLVVGGFAINANSASADCSITMTLRVGSVGTEVACMQSIVGATADGKFGPMTLAAVKAWQASHGLVADGVVGPLTRAAMMGAPTGNFPAGCTSASGYSSTTGVKCDTGVSSGLPAGCSTTAGYSPLTGVKCDGSTAGGGSMDVLEGGAGDITLTLRGTYSSEEVGEGEEDAKVLHVDIEADEDSDVRLDSVKVEFYQGTAADDRDLKDYASEVSVWLKGKKVGSDDTSDFSEATTNYFSKSISLDGAVIKAGDEDDLVIAVTANKSLDSGDIDTDAWIVDLLSVRFTDGAGVTTTESGSAAAVAAAGTYGKAFDFASFATANDAELTLSLDDDAINDVHLLDSDDTDDTDHPITSVLFDASGDSDIWVDEVSATITTTGETDESLIVVSSWIEVDGVRISEKEDVPAGGAVVYDDLDYTIAAGAEKEFIFWVTMQNVDGALDEGDTVQLTVDATLTAEDEAGDSVTAAGSDPVGGTHLLYDNGIRLVGNSQVATAFTIDGVNNDRVELELIFDVFNYGDVTLYIPDGDTLTGTPSTSATTTAPSTTEKVGYHVQTSGTVTPPSAQISAVLTENDSDLTPKTNSFELRSGKTGTFNLKVTISADENPSIDNVGFRALLAGLGWATSDVATAAVVYTADLGDYKTNYATIAD